MKKVLSLTAIILATVVPSLAARTQTNEGHAAQASDKVNNVAPRSGSDEAAVNRKRRATEEDGQSEKKKKSDSSEKKKKDDAKKTAESPKTASAAPLKATDTNSATSDAPTAKTPTTVPVGAAPVNSAAAAGPSKANSTAAPTLPSPALANIYRVGIGDVLSIQLLNAPLSNESTLFTVLAEDCWIPARGRAVPVAGLKTEEINAQLVPDQDLRRPRLAVSVREYASHHVIVTGLVMIPARRCCAVKPCRFTSCLSKRSPDRKPPLLPSCVPEARA